jgi:hypothetical protein
LLSARVTVESAAFVAVLLRLVTVVADVTLFALAFVIDALFGLRVASRALRGDRELRPVPATAATRGPSTPALPDRRSA